MVFTFGQKVKIIKNHDGKILKRPIYGYITCIVACKKAEQWGGISTEDGMKITGYAYSVQTSWSGGALWYTDAAIKPAGGKHRLLEWRRKLEGYHQKTDQYGY